MLTIITILLLAMCGVLIAIAERFRRAAQAAQKEIIALVEQSTCLAGHMQQYWAEGYNTGLLEGREKQRREDGRGWQKGYEEGWEAAREALEDCRVTEPSVRAA